MNTRFPVFGRLAFPMVAAALLAGCAASTYDAQQTYDSRHVSFLAPDSGHVTVNAREFRGEPRRRVVFDEAWQREEYVLYRGFGAQAELFYSRAAAGTYALEYEDLVERSVGRWNINRGQAKQWGEHGRVYSLFGDVFYRAYRLPALDRSCAGFSVDWDYRADDPFTRPSKVLFGYYCAAPGAPLAQEEIEDLIAGIRVGAPPRNSKGRLANADANGHAAALRIARGPSPKGETGLPSFPLYMARYYQDYGGNGRFN